MDLKTSNYHRNSTGRVWLCSIVLVELLLTFSAVKILANPLVDCARQMRLEPVRSEVLDLAIENPYDKWIEIYEQIQRNGTIPILKDNLPWMRVELLKLKNTKRKIGLPQNLWVQASDGLLKQIDLIERKNIPYRDFYALTLKFVQVFQLRDWEKDMAVREKNRGTEDPYWGHLEERLKELNVQPLTSGKIDGLEINSPFIFLPIFGPMTKEDFIYLHGVPLIPEGMLSEGTTGDGMEMDPLIFFSHDGVHGWLQQTHDIKALFDEVNGKLILKSNFKEIIARENQKVMVLKNDLMSLNKNSSQKVLKIAVVHILFELLHEQGLRLSYVSPEIVLENLGKQRAGFLEEKIKGISKKEKGKAFDLASQWILKRLPF
jgi:hypothetical protein